MAISLRNWRPRHLLAAWGAYWTGLVAVKLGPPIVEIIRVAGPKDGKGSVSAGFGDGGLYLDVLRNGASAWHGTAGMGAIALWVGGPPLVLWVAWLLARPSRAERHAATMAPDPRADARALGEGPAGERFDARDRERSDARLRE